MTSPTKLYVIILLKIGNSSISMREVINNNLKSKCFLYFLLKLAGASFIVSYCYHHFYNILRLFNRLSFFFFSLQVKRSANICNKHGIYEMPHELPSDLRLKDVWKLGKFMKISKNYRIIT